MDLDIKQQVLVTIYMEYQKDLPNMELINAEKMEIEEIKFNVAIDKLQHEKYISGAMIFKGGTSPIPQKVLLAHTKMTRDGIQYVEKILEIQETSTNKEKIKTAISKLGAGGFKVLAEIGTKIAVEMGLKMITGM